MWEGIIKTSDAEPVMFSVPGKVQKTSMDARTSWEHRNVIFCTDNANKKKPFVFKTLDWVSQTSINFKSQLNLKCKLISCTLQVNLSVN